MGVCLSRCAGQGYCSEDHCETVQDELSAARKAQPEAAALLGEATGPNAQLYGLAYAGGSGRLFSRVVVAQGHLLAGHFEAHVSAEAAEYCRDRCWEELLKVLGDAGTQPPAALTLRALDRGFLASTQLTLESRLTSGCSCTLVHVDLVRQTVTVATVGAHGAVGLGHFDACYLQQQQQQPGAGSAYTAGAGGRPAPGAAGAQNDGLGPGGFLVQGGEPAWCPSQVHTLIAPGSESRGGVAQLLQRMQPGRGSPHAAAQQSGTPWGAVDEAAAAGGGSGEGGSAAPRHPVVEAVGFGVCKDAALVAAWQQEQQQGGGSGRSEGPALAQLLCGAAAQLPLGSAVCEVQAVVRPLVRGDEVLVVLAGSGASNSAELRSCERDHSGGPAGAFGRSSSSGRRRFGVGSSGAHSSSSLSGAAVGLCGCGPAGALSMRDAVGLACALSGSAGADGVAGAGPRVGAGGPAHVLYDSLQAGTSGAQGDGSSGNGSRCGGAGAQAVASFALAAALSARPRVASGAAASPPVAPPTTSRPAASSEDPPSAACAVLWLDWGRAPLAAQHGMSPARRRWQLLRCYAAFRMARRRSILAGWWALVAHARRAVPAATTAATANSAGQSISLASLVASNGVDDTHSSCYVPFTPAAPLLADAAAAGPLAHQHSWRTDSASGRQCAPLAAAAAPPSADSPAAADARPAPLVSQTSMRSRPPIFMEFTDAHESTRIQVVQLKLDAAAAAAAAATAGATHGSLPGSFHAGVSVGSGHPAVAAAAVSTPALARSAANAAATTTTMPATNTSTAGLMASASEVTVSESAVAAGLIAHCGLVMAPMDDVTEEEELVGDIPMTSGATVSSSTTGTQHTGSGWEALAPGPMTGRTASASTTGQGRPGVLPCPAGAVPTPAVLSSAAAAASSASSCAAPGPAAPAGGRQQAMVLTLHSYSSPNLHVCDSGASAQVQLPPGVRAASMSMDRSAASRAPRAAADAPGASAGVAAAAGTVSPPHGAAPPGAAAPLDWSLVMAATAETNISGLVSGLPSGPGIETFEHSSAGSSAATPLPAAGRGDAGRPAPGTPAPPPLCAAPPYAGIGRGRPLSPRHPAAGQACAPYSPGAPEGDGAAGAEAGGASVAAGDAAAGGSAAAAGCAPVGVMAQAAAASGRQVPAAGSGVLRAVVPGGARRQQDLLPVHLVLNARGSGEGDDVSEDLPQLCIESTAELAALMAEIIISDDGEVVRTGAGSGSPSRAVRVPGGHFSVAAAAAAGRTLRGRVVSRQATRGWAPRLAAVREDVREAVNSSSASQLLGVTDARLSNISEARSSGHSQCSADSSGSAPGSGSAGNTGRVIVLESLSSIIAAEATAAVNAAAEAAAGAFLPAIPESEPASSNEQLSTSAGALSAGDRDGGSATLSSSAAGGAAGAAGAASPAAGDGSGSGGSTGEGWHVGDAGSAALVHTRGVGEGAEGAESSCSSDERLVAALLPPGVYLGDAPPVQRSYSVGSDVPRAPVVPAALTPQQPDPLQLAGGVQQGLPQRAQQHLPAGVAAAAAAPHLQRGAAPGLRRSCSEHTLLQLASDGRAAAPADPSAASAAAAAAAAAPSSTPAAPCPAAAAGMLPPSLAAALAAARSGGTGSGSGVQTVTSVHSQFTDEPVAPSFAGMPRTHSSAGTVTSNAVSAALEDVLKELSPSLDLLRLPEGVNANALLGPCGTSRNSSTPLQRLSGTGPSDPVSQAHSSTQLPHVSCSGSRCGSGMRVSPLELSPHPTGSPLRPAVRVAPAHAAGCASAAPVAADTPSRSYSNSGSSLSLNHSLAGSQLLATPHPHPALHNPGQSPLCHTSGLNAYAATLLADGAAAGADEDGNHPFTGASSPDSKATPPPSNPPSGVLTSGVDSTGEAQLVLSPHGPGCSSAAQAFSSLGGPEGLGVAAAAARAGRGQGPACEPYRVSATASGGRTLVKASGRTHTSQLYGLSRTGGGAAGGPAAGGGGAQMTASEGASLLEREWSTGDTSGPLCPAYSSVSKSSTNGLTTTAAPTPGCVSLLGSGSRLPHLAGGSTLLSAHAQHHSHALLSHAYASHDGGSVSSSTAAAAAMASPLPSSCGGGSGAAGLGAPYSQAHSLLGSPGVSPFATRTLPRSLSASRSAGPSMLSHATAAAASNAWAAAVAPGGPPGGAGASPSGGHGVAVPLQLLSDGMRAAHAASGGHLCGALGSEGSSRAGDTAGVRPTATPRSATHSRSPAHSAAPAGQGAAAAPSLAAHGLHARAMSPRGVLDTGTSDLVTPNPSGGFGAGGSGRADWLGRPLLSEGPAVLGLGGGLLSTGGSCAVGEEEQPHTPATAAAALAASAAALAAATAAAPGPGPTLANPPTTAINSTRSSLDLGGPPRTPGGRASGELQSFASELLTDDCVTSGIVLGGGPAGQHRTSCATSASMCTTSQLSGWTHSMRTDNLLPRRAGGNSLYCTGALVGMAGASLGAGGSGVSLGATGALSPGAGGGEHPPYGMVLCANSSVSGLLTQDAHAAGPSGLLHPVGGEGAPGGLLGVRGGLAAGGPLHMSGAGGGGVGSGVGAQHPQLHGSHRRSGQGQLHPYIEQLPMDSTGSNALLPGPGHGSFSAHASAQLTAGARPGQGGYGRTSSIGRRSGVGADGGAGARGSCDHSLVHVRWDPVDEE